MKKVMISQPISGKKTREIIETREKLIKYLKENGYEVIDNLLKDEWDNIEQNIIHKELYFIGKSIACMSQCDAVFFADGWAVNRGCRIERLAAVLYNLEIINESDKEDNDGK